MLPLVRGLVLPLITVTALFYSLGIWLRTGNHDVLGCDLETEEYRHTPPEKSSPFSAALSAILNGLTYFYYMSCLIAFAIWHCRDQRGRTSLGQFCCSKSENAKIIEQIGVGVIAALGILNSFACVIAAGVSNILNCGTMGASAFVILNVLVTMFNAAACTQVFVVYYCREDVQANLMTQKALKKKVEILVKRETSV